MKAISGDDTAKIATVVNIVISELGKGAKKVEHEIEVGEPIAIANVKGYWVSDLLRIDINFRR